MIRTKQARTVLLCTVAFLTSWTACALADALLHFTWWEWLLVLALCFSVGSLIGQLAQPWVERGGRSRGQR